MLSFIILFIILVCLALHSDLSIYWEQGRMPYSGGFTFFANLFALTYAFNFIWMLGVWPGIIVSVLCFFQLVYSSFLWLFFLPQSLRLIKNKTELKQLNQTAYGGFTLLVIVLIVLSVINFFLSDYKSLWSLIESNKVFYIVAFLSIIIFGNLISLAAHSYLHKKYD